MEATYFALGVLTMVAIIFVFVIVWGVVKVVRLNSNLKNFEVLYEKDMEFLRNQTDTQNSQIYNEITSVRNDLSKGVEEIRRYTSELHDESIRYTDKRFDKKSN